MLHRQQRANFVRFPRPLLRGPAQPEGGVGQGPGQDSHGDFRWRSKRERIISTSNQFSTWRFSSSHLISVLKESLALKTAWCGVLRRNLGISRWRRLGDACASATKSAAADLQDAIARGKEETKVREYRCFSFGTSVRLTFSMQLLSSQSLQKAKDSFEQLTNEVCAIIPTTLSVI